MKTERTIYHINSCKFKRYELVQALRMKRSNWAYINLKGKVANIKGSSPCAIGRKQWAGTLGEIF